MTTFRNSFVTMWHVCFRFFHKLGNDFKERGEWRSLWFRIKPYLDWTKPYKCLSFYLLGWTKIIWQIQGFSVRFQAFQFFRLLTKQNLSKGESEEHVINQPHVASFLFNQFFIRVKLIFLPFFNVIQWQTLDTKKHRH